jgi:hypothetical protein
MVRTALEHGRRTPPLLVMVPVLTTSLLGACSLDSRATGPADSSGADGVGGTSVVEPPGDGGRRGHRRRIVVAAQGAAVPQDASVSVTFDHAALVAEGRSLPSGEDVRVVRAVGDRLEELDRALDPGSSWGHPATVVWFRVQAALGEEESDSGYFLYHGDPGPGPARADPKQVYLFWDDFDAPMLGAAWKYSDIGRSRGWARPADGVLRLASRGGDIGGTEDSLSFLSVGISGDFSAEAKGVGTGGLLDSSAKLGGVMVRRSATGGSAHRMICRLKQDARFSSWRATDGGETSETEIPISDGASAGVASEQSRLEWRAGRTRVYGTADGERWDEPGAEVEIGDGERAPVRVGIPLATMQIESEGWVDVDWFRLRRLVTPEPTVTLEPEEEPAAPLGRAP